MEAGRYGSKLGDRAQERPPNNYSQATKVGRPRRGIIVQKRGSRTCVAN